jgi:glycosyltransferase involved in cell wall biosynthesis
MTQVVVGERDACDGIALLFVGNVVPDSPEYENPGFSRAGNLVQLGMLRGLSKTRMRSLSVVSAPPMPSRRNGGPFYRGGGTVDLGPQLRARLFPTLNLSGVKHIWSGVAALLAVLRWGWTHRRENVRVVCVYNLTYPPAAFAVAAATLIRARTVVWLNDVNVPGQTVPAEWRYRLEYVVQRWVASRFNAVIAVSNAIINDFGRGRPSLRMEGGVWEQMLEVHRLRPAERRDDPFVMVLAGSLDEANGVCIALDAMRRLVGDRYKLIVAGAGPLAEKVRAAAARDGRIEYRGYVSHREVLRLYECADVLLNIRVTQAIDTRYFFPSKLMEYLASGAPVLTTCTGHVEDEYGPFSFLLRDETPEGLASAVESMATMRRSIREAVGLRAKEYMAREKTWARQARRLLAFTLEAFAPGAARAE